ncbi:MAG: glycosyltransferase family 39 protein, partial [Candidatus Omnitrophica bacterium]|nr:glycosyltransferase family 39 protein [Candidatus Omnitrophota bacterium]
VFFFFGNSLIPLTDPDEVFYALTAKEMAAKGEWLVPHIFNQPQFEKPIFIYWLLRLVFDWWGATPFSARLFPAFFACMGVLGVYALGLLGFFSERRAFWSALVLCTGALFVGMGKTVFTDMVFSVFILYALLSFYLAFVNPRRKLFGIMGFYFFAGLAVLTKGPLGLLLPELTVILFLLYRGKLDFIYDRRVMGGFFLCLGIALPWYVFMINKYGHAFIHEFFYNDHWRRWLEAEHKGNDRWFFYPLTMIMGLFPWSLFFIAGCVSMFKKLKWGASHFEYFILSWILVVFIIFHSAHSKLASYILPLWPALALLTGGFIEDALTNPRSRLVRVFLMIMSGVAFIFGIAILAAYPVYQKYVPSILPAYFLSALLIAFAGWLVILLLKEKLDAALRVLSLWLLPFLWTGFIIRADIGPYISSFDAVQYLPYHPGQKAVILSSKPYARGIRYYTGQEMAVLNINGGNYFSPHPLPILKNAQELIQFIKEQKLTCAVLKKSGYKTINELLPADQFKVHMIKNIGYNYVLTIEFLPAT